MIPFSDEDLRPIVSEVVDRVRPSLALDGGDIKFIDVQNQRVFVQLQGACIGCSSSASTLKYGVEKEIKSHIHPELEVINVPFGMEERLDEL